MKKIFLLLLVTAGFTFSANAQEAKLVAASQELESYQVEAKNDTKEIAKYLNLDESTTKELYATLAYKEQEISQNPEILQSEEREIVFERVFTNKLENLFTADQFKKLKGNKVLFEKALR